jgi:hypothetical protein
VIDDSTYKLVSLALQLMVLPAGALLWWLISEVHSIRILLYREFVTKIELTEAKGEMRDTMQVALSGRGNGHDNRRHHA